MRDDFKVENLRYIVFLIESKFKEHDGMVFASLTEAREYCKSTIKKQYADKLVIGSFVMEQNASEMFINTIETYGFKGDKKNTEQLKLFNF